MSALLCADRSVRDASYRFAWWCNTDKRDMFEKVFSKRFSFLAFDAFRSLLAIAYTKMKKKKKKKYAQPTVCFWGFSGTTIKCPSDLPSASVRYDENKLNERMFHRSLQFTDVVSQSLKQSLWIYKTCVRWVYSRSIWRPRTPADHMDILWFSHWRVPLKRHLKMLPVT